MLVACDNASPTSGISSSTTFKWVTPSSKSTSDYAMYFAELVTLDGLVVARVDNPSRDTISVTVLNVTEVKEFISYLDADELFDEIDDEKLTDYDNASNYYKTNLSRESKTISEGVILDF